METELANKKTARIPKVYVLPDGTQIKSKEIPPFYRSLVLHARGYEEVEVRRTLKNGKLGAPRKVHQIVYDPDDPLGGKKLIPGSASPVCAKCGLDAAGAHNPYFEYAGPENPLVTIILDRVSAREDEAGKLASGSYAATIKKIIDDNAHKTGVSSKDVRWVPLTRCSNRVEGKVDYKIKGRWCRYHVLQDLWQHPPKVILPVGTQVLGLLSHKSNANDWSGRILTFRGWPDDWLMTPEFCLPRPHPSDPEKTFVGHPAMGPQPEMRIPMVPIVAPQIIHRMQSADLFQKWKGHILGAMTAARKGVKAMDYMRSWYRFTEDIGEIESALKEIVSRPGMHVCYDTETTGLRPWGEGAAVVSMMFRWQDENGKPRSIGFPWDFETSKVRPHMKRLRPLIWKALTRSSLIGHNLTFDVLYTYATLWHDKDVDEDGNLYGWDDTNYNAYRDRLLCQLADAADFDTWHMAYTFRQQRGTLGLEAIAYDYTPDLAGYEEEMTLLIGLHGDEMNPANNKGGHYLNCPRDKWDSHLLPYVMGDVEVCYRSWGRIQEKLDKAPTYKIPLAKPNAPGRFRWFAAPSREWVYRNIMSPASKVLMKLMGRGMYVDFENLEKLEINLPKRIRELRDDLRRIHPNILHWVESMEQEKRAKGENWQFDLEDKSQLKKILFDAEMLNLPVQRLTKTGKQLFGDTEDDFKKMTREDQIKYAAMDKWTLNKLAVDHENVRPLQEYRKVHKLYSTYVRPLRNILSEGIDKKARTKDPHLCFDRCIHAGFLLTGTRGGRLSCRDPNLQQLPRDGEVKWMYTSRFGDRGCLYQGDLSQIELRLMAAACGDPTMIKAYLDGEDLHSLTTSRIFRVPYEHFSKDYMKWLQSEGRDKEAKELDQKRNIGKTVNFLTGYGGGAFGLQNVLAAKSIYRSMEECETIIEAFFDSYPSLKKLLQYYKRFILDTSVAVSILGRVRFFEEVLSTDEEAKAKALRAGCNHLIQSTASDMMLIALHVIEKMMREANLESMLISTVHDSLVVDCIRSELPKVHEIVMLVLNNFDVVLPSVFGDDYDTSWMLVPFTGDCEVGPNYLETKKIPKEKIDWDELLGGHKKEK